MENVDGQDTTPYNADHAFNNLSMPTHRSVSWKSRCWSGDASIIRAGRLADSAVRSRISQEAVSISRLSYSLDTSLVYA